MTITHLLLVELVIVAHIAPPGTFHAYSNIEGPPAVYDTTPEKEIVIPDQLLRL